MSREINVDNILVIILIVFYSVAVVRRNVYQQFLEEEHITSVLRVCIDYYT